MSTPPTPSDRPDWVPGPAPRPRRRGPFAYLRLIFTEPFVAPPEDVLLLPRRQYEARRRSGLLRLILFNVALALIALLIPAALLGHASRFYLVTLVAEWLLAGICLSINHRLSSNASAWFFVFGTSVLGLNFAIENPAGLDMQGLLMYAILALVLLIAGLVLPLWAMWLAALALATATVAGVWLTPLAPPLASLPGGPRTVRLTALALLVANQALTAIFAWMYARNSAAGLRGALRAVARERELIQLKDQFLIYANHELRTPVMTWYVNTQILQRLDETLSPEQREHYVGRALNAGQSVLRLLNTVLDAGMLESGTPPLALQRVNLAPLIRDALETVLPGLARETGPGYIAPPSRPLEMETQEQLMVLADPDRVRQVLVNLMTNALKYSAPGTPITITAAPLPPPAPKGRRPRKEAAPALPAYAVVAVRDHGLGVPPSEAPKLFQRFVRLERDVAGSVRGTGVGLYLSRVLVEAMGGRVWVESSGTPGEGSTFSFTLPLAPTET